MNLKQTDPVLCVPFQLRNLQNGANFTKPQQLITKISSAEILI